MTRRRIDLGGGASACARFTGTPSKRDMEAVETVCRAVLDLLRESCPACGGSPSGAPCAACGATELELPSLPAVAASPASPKASTDPDDVCGPAHRQDTDSSTSPLSAPHGGAATGVSEGQLTNEGGA